MESAAEELQVATREKAAQLAGLSLRQVDYWSSTGLVGPTVDTRITPGRRIRLYGFNDLLALLAAAELRDRGFSLQHIRTVVKRFEDRGYERPLTELRWAEHVENDSKQPRRRRARRNTGRLYFQHDDGSWEGDLRPDQVIFSEVLHLEMLRRRIAAELKRDKAAAGRVERRRGALGSKPVLAGTRIPVDTVRRYLKHGHTVQEILLAFPDLTEADVEAVQRTIAA